MKRMNCHICNKPNTYFEDNKEYCRFFEEITYVTDTNENNTKDICEKCYDKILQEERCMICNDEYPVDYKLSEGYICVSCFNIWTFVDKNRMDLLKKYISNKLLDVNHHNESCFPPIGMAIRNENKEIVQFLLENGADIMELHSNLIYDDVWS